MTYLKAGAGMDVKTLIENLKKMSEKDEVKIVITNPKAIGPTPTVDIDFIISGFDWDNRDVLIIPSKPLEAASKGGIKKATKEVANLYIARFSGVTEVEYEIEMMRKIVVSDWPVDKMSRWLGFAQAGIIAKGFTTIDDERDLTRPFFHKAYQEAGLKVPESESIKK